MVLSENDRRLCDLLVSVFMMDESQYRDENGPAQIEGWDSLSLVSVAVGVHETFGHHMTPEEVGEIRTVGDIKAYLRNKGVSLQ